MKQIIDKKNYKNMYRREDDREVRGKKMRGNRGEKNRKKKRGDKER